MKIRDSRNLREDVKHLFWTLWTGCMLFGEDGALAVRRESRSLLLGEDWAPANLTLEFELLGSHQFDEPC